MHNNINHTPTTPTNIRISFNNAEIETIDEHLNDMTGHLNKFAPKAQLFVIRELINHVYRQHKSNKRGGALIFLYHSLIELDRVYASTYFDRTYTGDKNHMISVFSDAPDYIRQSKDIVELLDHYAEEDEFLKKHYLKPAV
ncbi:MAG: hypothetical protein KF874_08205 [Rhizobiaceae bacterium]|nr:hypothetical protein [Rhizobiaceae bacterium]